LKLLVKAVISLALLLLAGCGNNFEWFPDAGSTTTSNTTAATTTSPVANAGTAQTVALGTLVTMDGSGSTAGNGASLTYSWSVTKPSTSNATLSSATAVKPTFTPDVAGVYTFSLVVSNGTATSTAATVTVTADTAPVANAGKLQSVVINTPVTLDGSGSTDADGDALTYSWSFKSIPTNSKSSLSSTTAVKPTFTPDVSGDYVVQLVVKDGKLNSTASTVTITASVGNAPPVANAGPAQSVVVGTKVTLAGSATDANAGDTITYSWSFKSKPNGSSAVLSSATDVSPTFTPDVAGDYVIQLIANDGQVNSAASTVTVTATVGNAAPVANAGPAQIVAVNALVTLDGSGSSDANGDTLTYRWSFSTRPAGSASALSSTTAVKPTFTTDVAGDYIIQLIVNDGKVDSVPATVTVTATATGSLTVTIQ
jgi:hypothetical protein